jgi:hypothetical protein
MLAKANELFDKSFREREHPLHALSSSMNWMRSFQGAMIRW